jgi:hypothetical protein
VTASASDRGSAGAPGEQRRGGAAWSDLEALAAHEAQLVADGRFDELSAVHDRREALFAALPQPLPAPAIEPLRRALSVQQATETALRARRDAVAAELGRLQRGRTGVQGYARASDPRR